jgi:putative Mn2+ efflux pump MntP
VSSFSLFLVALGLSLDAFAVSIGCGANGKVSRSIRIKLALSFGLFQGIMPIIGWHIGAEFEKLIAHFDHWIAFFLLLVIGAKMIYDSFLEEDTDPKKYSTNLAILLLSIATSIDALVVGFSLALINVAIYYPSLVIGIVTLVMSLIGMFFGKTLQRRFGKKAEFLGGIIILAVGIKILLDHIA